MNFNFSGKAEYALNKSLVEEMIRLYGVLTKFLVTEKINKDDNVFGDYSHLKTDSSKIFEMYMMPENSEGWDENGYSINTFGLSNFESTMLFVAKSSFDNVLDMKSIVGNLIVFPNNRVMEITHINFVVPGVNNLFTYNDQKTVYKLTCKPHDFKLINEIDNIDMSTEDNVPYETLDVYFQELIDRGIDQKTEANVKTQVTTVDTGQLIDSKVKKAIVDKKEKSVWGDFD